MATDISILKDINLSGLAIEEVFPEYTDNQSHWGSLKITWELVRNPKSQTLPYTYNVFIWIRSLGDYMHITTDDLVHKDYVWQMKML